MISIKGTKVDFFVDFFLIYFYSAAQATIDTSLSKKDYIKNQNRRS